MCHLSLYFLIGQSDNELSKQKVYIGQTESIKHRIISHDKQKDFWNYLLFFISTDKELNSGHAKHLESLCINYAKQYKRCILDNTQLGNLNSLSLEDKAFVIEFLLNIKTILSSIGYRFLEPIVELSEDKIASNQSIQEQAVGNIKVYYLNKGKVKARGTYSSDGFVVLSGSIINKKGYETNKVFTDKVSFIENSLTTIEDIIFTSPSQASTMILGYPDNGRDSWKDNDGSSIKENQTL